MEPNPLMYQRLIEHTTDTITIIDIHFNIKYITPYCEVLLSYTSAFLTNKNLLKFCHPDDINLLKNIVSQLYSKSNSSKIFKFRFKNVDKDWVSLGCIIKNSLSDPYIKGFVINSRDITDRLQQEKELQEKNEFLNKIMSTAMNAIASLDMSGKFTLVNKRLTQITGYKKFELMNQTFGLLFSIEDIPEVMALFQKSIKQKKSFFTI